MCNVLQPQKLLALLLNDKRNHSETPTCAEPAADVNAPQSTVQAFSPLQQLAQSPFGITLSSSTAASTNTVTPVAAAVPMAPLLMNTQTQPYTYALRGNMPELRNERSGGNGFSRIFWFPSPVVNRPWALHCWKSRAISCGPLARNWTRPKRDIRIKARYS